MARIFISYSRVDIAFVEELYRRLQQMRPNFRIWYDQAPHGLLGGDSWWEAILDAIKECDIFIYVLSNESVQSRYCQAEFTEAQRLQKRIITIQARDRTKLTDELSDIQYVDMKHGVNDAEAIAKLSGALERQLGLVSKRRAAWQPRTARPTDEVAPARSADAPDVDTPTLQAPPQAVETTTGLARSTRQRSVSSPVIMGIVGIIVIVVIAVALLSQLTVPSTGLISTATPANPQTAAAMFLTDQALPTLTNTPDETTTLQVILTDLVQTVTANAQATMDTYTDTPTATFTPSDTPTDIPTSTPDLTQTAEAVAQAQAFETNAAQFIIDEAATQNAQLTANAPTNTLQPSSTPTSTVTRTATNTPSPTQTFTPTPDAAQTAVFASVTANAFETQVMQTAISINNAHATETAVLPLPSEAMREYHLARVISDQRVNVRRAASTSAMILTSLAPGSNVSVLEQSDDGEWARVRLEDNNEGWIASFLLEISATPRFGVLINDDWSPFFRDFGEVTMMLVPAGCFMMGSESGDSDEEPVHEQCFDKPFWIDQTEVSNAQFAAFNGQAASESTWTQDNRPRENIAWGEARNFCELRGARLPTEAEWEYAARGPDGLEYPWGSWNENNAVWDRSNSEGTLAVGSLLAGASWVGALDMSGNVWEWTNSLYVNVYSNAAEDEREGDIRSSEDVRYVLRGGSWDVNVPNNLRAANRNWNSPVNRLNIYGFRCARSVE